MSHQSGTVRHVHGPGIDRPLAVLAGQTYIVNYTWRGLGESSLTPTGAGADCSLGGVGCAAIDWPIDRGVYFTKHSSSAAAPTVYKWMGTLTANGGSGTTGLLYRRNRYYDSETARWTQEDPIGIAGGINVFGFAAGDPVNHSDPFGLKVEFANNESVGLWNALVSMAQAAMASEDESVRDAGIALNGMLRTVWESDRTWKITAGKSYFHVPGWSGATTAGARGNAFTRIDASRVERRFGMDGVVALAHELGHAHGVMTNDPGTAGAGVGSENLARSIKGCSVMRTDEHTRPAPCR